MSHALLLLLATALSSYYLISLVYRFKNEHLYNYPGPQLAKWTSLYNLYYVWRKSLHLEIKRLHDLYGPVVQLAPKRLSFNSAQAYLDIYGQGRPTRKSPGYSPHPYYPSTTNLFSTVDKSEFLRKKRLVLQGFSENQLQLLDSNLEGFCKTFCRVILGESHLEASGAEKWSLPVDIDLLFISRSTLLTNAVYGRHLDLMTSPEYRWWTSALIDGNRWMYLCLAWPRFFLSRLSAELGVRDFLFPKMMDESHRFQAAVDCLINRRAECVEKQDILSALELAESQKLDDQPQHQESRDEALALIRAGGDTTSAALSAAFFYLAQNTTAYQRAISEVRSSFKSIEAITSAKALSRCTYLRACIDEAMRLSPPAPGCFWRQVVGKATQIDGHEVPPGFEVGVCQYAIHHSSAYFPKPYAFKPERFCEAREHAVIPPGAFAPFQLGPRACPAKALEYRITIVLLCRVLWCTDFKAVQRQEGHEFLIEDVFSADKKGPCLIFKQRKVVL